MEKVRGGCKGVLRWKRESGYLRNTTGCDCLVPMFSVVVSTKVVLQAEEGSQGQGPVCYVRK